VSACRPSGRQLGRHASLTRLSCAARSACLSHPPQLCGSFARVFALSRAGQSESFVLQLVGLAGALIHSLFLLLFASDFVPAHDPMNCVAAWHVVHRVGIGACWPLRTPLLAFSSASHDSSSTTPHFLRTLACFPHTHASLLRQPRPHPDLPSLAPPYFRFDRVRALICCEPHSHFFFLAGAFIVHAYARCVATPPRQ
jgi:hypothetical protein